ncbi:MAG: CinA family protein [Marmoricola sp.]
MTPKTLQELLEERSQTVCCAESLTGGSLAVILSETPGSSAVFLGGVVSYATAVKRSVLGVTAPQVISAECAAQMASGVRDLLSADWALSTTGVAGPEPQEDQPVGTVFIGIAGPEGARAIELDLSGTREEIRATTCREAVAELVRELS